MTFTDDDLKRLKESVLKVDAEIGSTDRYMNTMLKAGNLAALLARLEAAEVCCELTYFHFGEARGTLTPMALELKESSEAWRKAAGK